MGPLSTVILAVLVLAVVAYVIYVAVRNGVLSAMRQYRDDENRTPPAGSPPSQADER